MTADSGPPCSGAHILLVEDDDSLAEWIADYLIEHGYLVTRANRGDEAVRMILGDQPDLVILDINLPVKDGFDVCKEVRRFSTRPILMLTARFGETDEVLGLELGADDFLGKPVKPRVLLARIKALLRRELPAERASEADSLCSIGGLRVDARSRSTRLDGVPVRISSQEFEVLWQLVRVAGQIVNRAALVAQLRGLEYDGFDRSVDMLISRLRKKLGDDPLDPRRIKTIRGKGYLLTTDGW